VGLSVTKKLFFLGKKEVSYNNKITNMPCQFNLAVFFDSKDIESISLSYDKVGRFDGLSFGDSVDLELNAMPDGKKFKYFLPRGE